MNAKAMFSLHSIRSGEQVTAGEILHSSGSRSFAPYLFALLIPCSKFNCSIFAFGKNRGDRTPIELFTNYANSMDYGIARLVRQQRVCAGLNDRSRIVKPTRKNDTNSCPVPDAEVY